MAERFKHFFYRVSFAQKLLLTLLLVAIVPVMILGSFMLSTTAQAIRQNYEESSFAVLERVVQQIDQYIDQTDEAMFVALYGNSEHYSQEIDAYNALQEQLLYIMLTGVGKESLLYYFPEKKEVYIVDNSGIRSFQNADDLEKQEWYQQSMNHPQQCVVLPQHLQNDYADRYEMDASVPVFTICRAFHPTGKNMCVLATNCKVDVFLDIYAPEETTTGESLICLTGNGELLYSTNQQEDASEMHTLCATIVEQGGSQGALSYYSQRAQQQTTVVYQISEQTGIITMKQILDSSLNRSIIHGIKMAAGILILLLIAILLLGISLVKTVTKPLSVLEKKMQAFGGGEMNARMQVYSQDEIGNISRSFNAMAAQIQALIQERYELQLSCRTAQMQSLIAQINPHFLNNTLQSIGNEALERDMPEIYEAVTTLARLLRYSIKGGNQVTLKDELDNISNYLFIQKFRYEDRLHYTFDTDPDLLGLPVPKLILQPLVENAIVHGLEPKKEPGCIRVRCFVDDSQDICLCVEDDGDGMAEEARCALLQRCCASDATGAFDNDSIGVVNVYRRMRLTYGAQFRFEIESSPMHGARYTLRIRKKDGEKKDETDSC